MSRFAVVERRGELPAQVVCEGVAPTAVTLSIYDRLEDIEAVWRVFEARADATAFQAFDWLAAWCRHIGWRLRTEPAIVLGCREDGKPLFLLPLAVTPGAVARLTFLGSDLCDYNAPLLAPDFSQCVAAEDFASLWRDILRLVQTKHRFDLVDLTKLPERVGSQINPFVTLSTRANPSNAYVSDLFGTWTEFYEAKRSSATRRRDRTKLKRMGELGDVRFAMPMERDEIERTMAELAAQKSKALARMGAPDMFARPGWRDFYADIAANPCTRRFVHVSRLEVGGAWVAINLGLMFRDTYYHVLASYEDGEVARFGPGAAHLRQLMQFAIEQGLKHFDFTIGDERYKLEWSDRTLPLFDHVAAATARGWPAAAMMHGHRRLKRLIKQNEVLWTVFSRLRAVFGSKNKKGAEEAGGAEAEIVRKAPPLAPS